jgi:hypothetical protein
MVELLSVAYDTPSITSHGLGDFLSKSMTRAYDRTILA